MPQVTDVYICNLALRKIHEETISDLSENASCDQLYPQVRDEMLSRHDWSFATERAQIASTSEDVTGDETLYVYPFPTTPYCLRVIEVIGALGDWSVEGRDILTAATSPITIRYIARATEDLFPPEFIQAFAARLATELAIDSGANPQLMALIDNQLGGPGALWDRAVHADIREKQVGQKPTSRRSRLWIHAR